MRVHLRYPLVFILYSISYNCYSQQTDPSFNKPGLITQKASSEVDYKLILVKKELTKNSQILNKSSQLKNDSSKKKITNPLDISAFHEKKSFIKFSGGIVSYNYNYRSFIDTPFTGTNVSQHYLLGNLNFQLAEIFPIRVNYLIKHSNSNYLKNINDVQVIFDGVNYRNNINEQIRKRFLPTIPQINDSLTGLNYNLKLKEFDGMGDWLQNPFQQQKLIEAQEIIQIPEITRDYNLPDSIAKARTDSLLRAAQKFITIYSNKKNEYDSVKRNIDSLKEEYDKTLSGIQKYKELINAPLSSVQDFNILKKELDNYNINSAFLNKYKWLMGIRQVAVGKNLINYSELTAKNINSTGINFEYNSWYYLTIAAGTIDYRFKDFVIKPANKSPQYLYLGRIGIGNIQKNNIIISLFKGRKQVYVQNSLNARSSSLNITGLSLETRWNLNSNSYIQAEIAQSQLPAYVYNQDKAKKFIDLSDKTNKAFSFKLNYNLPRLQTRFDGMYKYTGANYQSFTSFQTNSSLQAWHLKVGQYFLKRSLKVSASVKSNEFTNPFIIQNYKSNTIFKSFNAIYQRRNYPTISIAYSPITQLTFLNNEYSESKFYSLTSSLNYSYKIKDVPTMTTIVYSKFYNTQADSGYFFYNSNNLMISQSFINKMFTEGFGISFSDNTKYQLLVIDGNIFFNFKNLSRIGMGAKVNNLSKLGTYWSVQSNIKKLGVFRFTYDQGYLPGNNYKLIKNDNLNVSFTKII